MASEVGIFVDVILIIVFVILGVFIALKGNTNDPRGVIFLILGVIFILVGLFIALVVAGLL